MEYAIEAEGLSRTYKNKVALSRFSLKVRRGEVFGLLGPNGAGKSTFIRIVAGLERQDLGTLKIFGREACPELRRQIGIAPQENAIYPLLSCMENLLYFGSLYGIEGKEARERAAFLLESLGLSEKKDTTSQFLSGGMKRRLSLACALMHSPKVIILDEPTTGLDPATRISMWETMKKVVADAKATLILTTHYMEEAEALCNRIAFVNSGKLVAEGTLDELKKMVGREIAKLKSVPGSPKELIKLIKGIKGVESVTATEHGMVIEGKEIGLHMAEISKALKENGETIVELSISKPSLEDVFLKLTGSKLREASAVEHNK
ncbi:MAG: ABC transporter ATP-binding protein [Candidatus Anstonellales archaeon]